MSGGKITAEEMRKVATQTKDQIETQRTEIQHLIGSRYKDIIKAADMLSTMHSNTVKLEKILHEMPSSCDGLRKSPAYRDSASGAAAMETDSKFTIGFHIKIVMDSSEQISKHMEDHKYLEAALTFLKAKSAYSFLQAKHTTDGDLFSRYPFLYHRWACVNEAQTKILDKSKKFLDKYSKESDPQKFAGALAVQVLMDSGSIEQALVIFLDSRTRWIKDLLVNKFKTDNQEKELQSKLCKAMRAVHSTITGVAAIFAPTREQPTPLLAVCLQQWVDVANEEAARGSAVERADLGRYGESVAVEALQQRTREWFQQQQLQVSLSAPALLSRVSTVRALALIQHKLEGYIGTIILAPGGGKGKSKGKAKEGGSAATAAAAAAAAAAATAAWTVACGLVLGEKEAGGNLDLWAKLLKGLFAEHVDRLLESLCVQIRATAMRDLDACLASVNASANAQAQAAGGAGASSSSTGAGAGAEGGQGQEQLARRVVAAATRFHASLRSLVTDVCKLLHVSSLRDSASGSASASASVSVPEGDGEGEGGGEGLVTLLRRRCAALAVLFASDLRGMIQGLKPALAEAEDGAEVGAEGDEQKQEKAQERAVVAQKLLLLGQLCWSVINAEDSALTDVFLAGRSDSARYSEAQLHQALGVSAAAARSGAGGAQLTSAQIGSAQKVLAIALPEPIVQSGTLQVDEFVWYINLHQRADEAANGQSFNDLLKTVADHAMSAWGGWLAASFGRSLEHSLTASEDWSQSDTSWHTQHAGWEEVTIAEEGEDGEELEETVW